VRSQAAPVLPPEPSASEDENRLPYPEYTLSPGMEDRAMTRFLIWLLALALAGCAAAPLEAPRDAPPRVPPPQVKAGDFWEYSVRDGYTGFDRGLVRYEVTRVEPGRVVVDVVHDGVTIDTHVYAPGWQGIEHPLPNLQRFRYEPAFPALVYPLEPGQRWRAVVTSTDPQTGRTYRTHVHGRVLGWERVKVPAGEFDALRVQRQVFAGNAEYFRTQEEIIETEWYAPAIGRSVMSQASSQHFDTSKGGNGNGGGEYPLRIRGDWLIAELVRHSAR
jgi:hypothetical protein